MRLGQLLPWLHYHGEPGLLDHAEFNSYRNNASRVLYTYAFRPADTNT